MAWLDNGVTNTRTAQDQAPAVGPWGVNAVTVNFNPINNVGYLRKLWLRIPYSTSAVQLAATGNTIALLAEKDWPIDRALGSFSLIAQGIAPIYQLSKGAIDLKYLRYVGSGRPMGAQYPAPGVSEANAATNTMLQGHTSDQWQFRQGVTIGTQQGAGPFTQAAAFAATWDVPITEWVVFPGGTIPGPQGGNPIALPGQVAEVGLLAAQNTQVNFRTSAILNPFSVLTGGTYDTVTKATTAVPTTGFLSPTMQLWSEFYDVPTAPANQPPPYAQQWVITRQTRDWPVATNQVFPKFEPAGLLLRAIYVFVDANDQIIDISGQTTDGTISFKWGSSVYKFNAETFEFNLARSAEFYGDAPPAGCLIHDFFRDHSLTDVINTALLPSVSAEIKGLPGTVASCHVIEERMVPVQVG